MPLPANLRLSLLCILLLSATAAAGVMYLRDSDDDESVTGPGFVLEMPSPGDESIISIAPAPVGPWTLLEAPLKDDLLNALRYSRTCRKPRRGQRGCLRSESCFVRIANSTRNTQQFIGLSVPFGLVVQYELDFHSPRAVLELVVPREMVPLEERLLAAMKTGPR